MEEGEEGGDGEVEEGAGGEGGVGDVFGPAHYEWSINEIKRVYTNKNIKCVGYNMADRERLAVQNTHSKTHTTKQTLQFRSIPSFLSRVFLI